MNTFHQANESILIVPVPIATLEYYQSLRFNIKHLGRSFIYLLYVRRVILKICKFVEAVEELQIFMRLQPKISQGNGIICHCSLIDITDRLEICRDCRDRRSCKIFPSCVKFWGNNANSLGNYRVTYALNE